MGAPAGDIAEPAQEMAEHAKQIAENSKEIAKHSKVLVEHIKKLFSRVTHPSRNEPDPEMNSPLPDDWIIEFLLPKRLKYLQRACSWFIWFIPADIMIQKRLILISRDLQQFLKSTPLPLLGQNTGGVYFNVCVLFTDRVLGIYWFTHSL